MLQVLLGMAKDRLVPPARKGPPNGPFAFRVSAMRQGVTGTKVSTELKIANTVWDEFMVTVQVCAPEQAPLHPVNAEPVAGTAVNVTVAPLARFAEQVVPQLIEPSLLVTVPVPVP